MNREVHVRICEGLAGRFRRATRHPLGRASTASRGSRCEACPEPVEGYAFIESDLVGEFPLPVICRVLSVTQAGYHAWVKRPASAMVIARDALADLIS